MAHTALHAQANDASALLATAKKQLYSNTEKALKTTAYLFKTAETNQEKADAGNLLATIYILKGEYTAALDQLAAISDTNANSATNTEVAVTSARLTRLLGLQKIADAYLRQAIQLSGGDPKKQWQGNNAINFEKANQLIATGKFDKAIALLKKVAEKYLKQKDFEGAFFALIASADACRLHEKTGDLYSALERCVAAERLATAHNLPALKIYAWRVQCGIHMQREQYDAANSLSVTLLPETHKTTDALLKRDVYKCLADSYDALGNLDKYSFFNREYDLLDDILIKERARANTAFSAYIEKDFKNREAKEDSHFSNATLYIAAGACLLVVSSTIYFFLLGREGSQYRRLLAGMDANTVRETALVQNTEPKVYAIPEKTEKALLEKLERFEASGRFTKNTVSLNALARYMDTNTKYLSEIINTHKGGNFNAYINDLRIKYILKKLQAEPVYLQYKVSYLAEECGFSSHSAFATVFKNVTGFSPTAYITMLRKEAEVTPPAL